MSILTFLFGNFRSLDGWDWDEGASRVCLIENTPST